MGIKKKANLSITDKFASNILTIKIYVYAIILKKVRIAPFPGNNNLKSLRCTSVT